jgi:hypothetical protein
MQAADFFGDTEAYSAAVRELAETLYPSLHAYLDGHTDTLDYPTGLRSKIQVALANAFHTEHGISPISQVHIVAMWVLSSMAWDCSLECVHHFLSPDSWSRVLVG